MRRAQQTALEERRRHDAALLDWVTGLAEPVVRWSEPDPDPLPPTGPTVRIAGQAFRLADGGDPSWAAGLFLDEFSATLRRTGRPLSGDELAELERCGLVLGFVTGPVVGQAPTGPLCACGCGRLLEQRPVGRPARFATPACRQRAHRARADVAEPTRAELFDEMRQLNATGDRDPAKHRESWRRIAAAR